MKKKLPSWQTHPFFAGVRRRSVIGGALAAVAAPAAMAQALTIDIDGVGGRQYPIGLPVFKGEEQSPQKISAIVQADLERSGFFKTVNSAGVALDELSRPDMALWRQRTAEWLNTGSVRRTADGRFDIRFRLWEVGQAADLGGQNFVVPAADLRLAAHRIADFIYEKVTGMPGAFSSRLAYVSKSGPRYTLWVADSDGENAQAALTSPEPIISPSWSPNGAQLAYVSFESRKPVVYVHEVASGQRRLLANFRGSNSAPAWSPDGKSLAVTLTRDGRSQLYTISASGGEPTRIMQSSGIDTEPAFSSDGAYIYFVSDRGGSPQIYRVGAKGGGAQRVTFQGNYNISPAISPDGSKLAYISRVSGGYRLHLMDLSSGSITALTQTGADESPSFAPNGQLIVYATRQGGGSILMTTTIDGQIKARLSSKSGEIREPDWGPIQF